MSSPEQLISSSILNLVVPDISIQLPPQHTLDGDSADAWLSTLTTSDERTQAFFDERLDFLLTIRIAHPTRDRPLNPKSPPIQLLTLLAQLQISLDATYISPVPVNKSHQEKSGFLTTPPVRTASVGRLRPRPAGAPPALFPPSTPNPTPFTAEPDRQYVKSEGTLLQSYIWGEDSSEESRDAIVLLWSQKENLWVAVYRLAVGVLFLRTSVPDPLLCLTVSATLRENILTSARSARHPLANLLAAAGGLPPSDTSVTTSPNGVRSNDDEQYVDYNGLEEVNLLDGLAGGPTFAASSTSPSLFLPSSRLGSTLRRDAFNLPPIIPTSQQVPAPTPVTARAMPTIRKSFRKTLHTVSGFRVRMRTVFVPYVLIPGNAEDEDERREAGSEERTVVLCVEVENSGESRMGFAVEGVEVSVGGEGASAKLIGWGKKGFSNAETVFPLFVGSTEQFNLLYAVSFLSPSDVDDFSLIGRNVIANKPSGPSASELQRAVAIHVKGRPYEMAQDDGATSRTDHLLYQTRVFSSRWNCVLDLSANRSRDSVPMADSPGSGRDALPAPASPFPVSSPQTTTAKEKIVALVESQPQAVAGSKRHTVAAMMSPAGPRSHALTNKYRASTSMLNTMQRRESSNLGKHSFTPPALSTQGFRRPTTPSALSASLSPPLPALPPGEYNQEQYAFTPPTPAYPAYPNMPLPPTPYFQEPLSVQTNNIGPTVEMRHVRSPQPGLQQTPGPHVSGSYFGDSMMSLQDADGEPIVVSVGVLPLLSDVGIVQDRICALDEFTLDIFVFNQSSSTRRFEVSYPDRKRRRRERDGYHSALSGPKPIGSPGILPLENRVRVGPLRPSTCQSVRMQFLAVTPGVHSIDTLTLTDIESGVSLNLRSVMDVVVHETPETDGG